MQPVEVVSYKIGVCKVSPRGKECRTEFERLSFNGKTSVVLCRPFTGRMHQIRVHLQYLGEQPCHSTVAPSSIGIRFYKSFSNLPLDPCPNVLDSGDFDIGPSFS